MYKTYPTFAISASFAAVVLAFGLPAIAPILPIAQTAWGLHLALLVLAMMMLQAMAEGGSKGESTWPMEIGVPLSIVAGATALGATSHDGAAEIALRAGSIAVLVGLSWGAGVYFSKLRPRGWGNAPRRDLVIIALGLAALFAWNHLYQFPQAQGTALVFDLVGLALLWNTPRLGQTTRASLSRRQAWARRVLDAAGFALLMAYVFAPDWFFRGDYAAGFVAMVMAALFAAHVGLAHFKDRSALRQS